MARRPDRKSAFIGLFVACLVGYTIYVGGDWMPFNRFLVPIVPVVACSAAWGVQALWNDAPRRHHRALTVVASLLSGAFVYVHVDSHVVVTPREQRKLGEALHSKRHTNRNLLANRFFVQAMLREPGEVLVTDYGGVFAFFTNARVIEMWGLCNKDIALRGDVVGINPIYGKTCVPCYREFNPDYFHVNVPITRPPNALSSQWQVINEVFQGPAINAVVDLGRRYATGRVLSLSRRRALFFLERRRPEYPLVPRRVNADMVVDYPFEPAGAYRDSRFEHGS